MKNSLLKFMADRKDSPLQNIPNQTIFSFHILNKKSDKISDSFSNLRVNYTSIAA